MVWGDMENRLLICTNGFEGSWPAIEYGSWIAEAIQARVALLAILEQSGHDAGARLQVEGFVHRAQAFFSQHGRELEVRWEDGNAEEIIPATAAREDCIVVLGPLGRPFLRRFLVGRSIRGLLEEITAPVVYVPRACLPLRKLLFCAGGLGYDITAEHLGVRLGLAAGAKAVLLHVAPPVDLEYPTAIAEREHWKDLVNTDTLTGRNLRRALDQARAAGLNVEIRMRQGSVLDEIKAELRDGRYDLICMGSGHSAHGLRQLYEPNLTDEIAEGSVCPMLTARYDPATRSLNGSVAKDSTVQQGRPGSISG
jgi:nucleotide-binding universal stress UspA family protein